MRVKSFALVHKFLYSPDSDAHMVEMREYLANLTKHLIEALFLTGDVRIVTETDPMRMPRDQAVTIGLIINELVTNAAKHAYPDGKHGRIRVGVTRGNGEIACISVRDEGVGLPPAFDLEKRGRGLGMRLATALAQQSGAKIAVKRLAKGTEFVIELALVGM
jgi:two-component sensor histidine kinase